MLLQAISQTDKVIVVALNSRLSKLHLILSPSFVPSKSLLNKFRGILLPFHKDERNNLKPSILPVIPLYHLSSSMPLLPNGLPAHSSLPHLHILLYCNCSLYFDSLEMLSSENNE